MPSKTTALLPKALRALFVSLVLFESCGCGADSKESKPLFTVTLPDSKHRVTQVTSRLGSRIAIISPDAIRSGGMAPPATLQPWSRWLVIKVLETVDSATPRYYFIDQQEQKVVGPWAPKEKVFLETFNANGVFVAFAREWFEMNRSLTKKIHFYDPATQTATTVKPPSGPYRIERISLDGSTMALARGGVGEPLAIDIVDIRDGAKKNSLEFPTRQQMSQKPFDWENYGYAWDLSPDGSMLALAKNWMDQADQNAVEIWDTKSGKRAHKLEQAQINGARLSSIRFSPDGNELVLHLSSKEDFYAMRRFHLTTGRYKDGFNPWEGVTSRGFQSRAFHMKRVGLDGQHVLSVRHGMPPDRLDFFEWEIQVADRDGNTLRDWVKLPDRVARVVDDRLDATIVPDTTVAVIMHEYAAQLTAYDWKSDEVWRLAGTNKKHDFLDHYAVQPGRVSVLYREANSDVTVSVWALPNPKNQ